MTAHLLSVGAYRLYALSFIFNSTGQLIETIPLQSTPSTLDISDLSAGIYVFQLQQNGENSRRTIVLE